MLFNDRLKRAFYALFKASVPRLDYFGRYRARVIKFDHSSQTVDVIPDDPRIPSMGGVRVRNGIAGLNTEMLNIAKDTTLLVGWSGGDPSVPFAESWGGGESVSRATLVADSIVLGGDGAEPTLKGQTYRTAEAQQNQQLATTLTGMASASTGALAPLAAGFTALAAAIQAFEAQAETYPTTKVSVV